MQLTQRIRPAYGFADAADTDLAAAARARRAPHQREPRHPRDRHRARRLRHALRPARLARDAARPARQRDRSVLRDALDPRWRPQVTLMTFSEFGRRPEENGDGGTDHGTAAPHLRHRRPREGRAARRAAEPHRTSTTTATSSRPSTSTRCTRPSCTTWLDADADRGARQDVLRLSLFTSGPGGAVDRTGAGLLARGTDRRGARLRRGTKFGSIAHVAKPIVAGAATPTHKGLWLVSSTAASSPSATRSTSDR